MAGAKGALPKGHQTKEALPKGHQTKGAWPKERGTAKGAFDTKGAGTKGYQTKHTDPKLIFRVLDDHFLCDLRSDQIIS